MDCYEIWCDLVDSSQDLAFCKAVDNYLGYLKGKGLVENFRVRRRKFGFSPTGDRTDVHDIQATILHLLGIDHKKLTFRFQGRDFRLTDVAGNVVQPLLA